MGIYNATVNEPAGKFAGLLARIQSKPKATDRKFEVLEEVKAVLNFDTLTDLALADVQALLNEILRDAEVAQYADKITWAEVFGYAAPKASVNGSEAPRKRMLARDMERLRDYVPVYFEESEGRKSGMAQIVADILDQVPEATESAVKQVVRELVDAKIIETSGERRNMVYFKAAAKQKKAS